MESAARTSSSRRVRRVFYLNWLRPSVFVAGLWADPGNSSLRKKYASVGGQVDLHFSVLHWYDMTLSAGYAVGYQGSQRIGLRVHDLAQDHVGTSSTRRIAPCPSASSSPHWSGCCRCLASSPRCSISTATSSSRLRTVVAVIASGIAVAGVSYFVNAYALEFLALDFTHFTRYVGPIIEELLKGVVILLLIRAHRIGFLVDAAIFGFAVGTGFAVVENLYLPA